MYIHHVLSPTCQQNIKTFTRKEWLTHVNNMSRLSTISCGNITQKYHLSITWWLQVYIDQALSWHSSIPELHSCFVLITHGEDMCRSTLIRSNPYRTRSYNVHVSFVRVFPLPLSYYLPCIIILMPIWDQYGPICYTLPLPSSAGTVASCNNGHRLSGASRNNGHRLSGASRNNGHRLSFYCELRH